MEAHQFFKNLINFIKVLFYYKKIFSKNLASMFRFHILWKTAGGMLKNTVNLGYLNILFQIHKYKNIYRWIIVLLNFLDDAHFSSILRDEIKKSAGAGDSIRGG
ncbi:hypothetical protein ACJX0J_017619 [Zea mays]